MKNIFKHLMIAALFGMVLPAQAAVQTYNFSGLLDSGFYNSQTFTGSFSFDDASVQSVGDEFISLSTLSFNLGNLGQYSLLTPALPDADAKAVFKNGIFSGLEWSVDSTTPNIGFSFIAGDSDTSSAYLAYDTSLGLSGTGTIIYTLVPEPDVAALMLAGLGLMGFASRRKLA